MIISAEQQSEFLHEILAIQNFIQNEADIKISSEVIENNIQIPFIKIENTKDEEEEIITEIVNYNHNIASKIPKQLIGSEIAYLERLCKCRLSRKLIKSDILNKRNGFFSKVDKLIFIPSNDRIQCHSRSIVTISSNFHYNGDVIDIRTVISINSIANFTLPSLQKLLSSLSF